MTIQEAIKLIQKGNDPRRVASKLIESTPVQPHSTVSEMDAGTVQQVGEPLPGRRINQLAALPPMDMTPGQGTDHVDDTTDGGKSRKESDNKGMVDHLLTAWNGTQMVNVPSPTPQGATS